MLFQSSVIQSQTKSFIITKKLSFNFTFQIIFIYYKCFVKTNIFYFQFRFTINYLKYRFDILLYILISFICLQIAFFYFLIILTRQFIIQTHSKDIKLFKFWINEHHTIKNDKKVIINVTKIRNFYELNFLK